VGYAVELYFDRDTEERIGRLWDVYKERDFTSLLPAIGSRPHISLAVFTDVILETLNDVVVEVAQSAAPLELGLAAVAGFPGNEGVLFLAPTVSRELVTLHEALHHRLQESGLRANPYYLPGRWVPHCTIASDLPSHPMNRGETPRA